MDGFRAANFGDTQNLADVEVRLGRSGRSDVVGLVGLTHVQRSAIDIGVDRDRADAHLAAGTNHAHGNFAAIGDQDFFEHSWDGSELLILRFFPSFGGAGDESDWPDREATVVHEDDGIICVSAPPTMAVRNEQIEILLAAHKN